jgi:Lon protease-like protein
MATVVELPIFPLPDVILFPGLRVPLHIFEPRYRQMMEAVLASDGRIGMVAVLPAQIDSMHGNPATFSIGCAGTIQDCERLADGRYNVVLLGAERFRIRCERPPTATRLYRIAEVELLEEANDLEDSAEFVRQHADLVSLFSELSNRLRSIGKLVATDCADDRARAANALDESENAVLINSIASAFNFTTEEKQALLEEDGRCARFERVCALLRFALAELHAGEVPNSGSLH